MMLVVRRALYFWGWVGSLASFSGCSWLLGSPFDDEYMLQSDAGVAGASSSGVQVAPSALDECKPRFYVSNHIRYPSQSTGPVELTTNIVNTDTDERCDKDNKDYCVIIGNTIDIPHSVNDNPRYSGVVPRGKRALVLLAAGDIHIDGILSVAGFDGWEERDPLFRAPGDHAVGMASHVAGGGGNASAGGGSCDGAGAGRKLLLNDGLVGGGHGAVYPDPHEMNCTYGGGGGGALQLVSLCGTIYITDHINARGGGGRGGGQDVDRCRDGFGGGAGGTVWLQGKVEIRSPDDSPAVQLTGGGGGGGSCLPMNAMTVTHGETGGVLSTAAAARGGACESAVMGGEGGLGGRSDAPPGAGGRVRPSGQAELARCGGGGGARGRLILQDTGLACDDLENGSDGMCVIASPVTPESQ